MKIDYKALYIKVANAGYTMTELFGKAKVSTSTLSNIKAGRNVQGITAKKLAGALGISVEELLKIDD